MKIATILRELPDCVILREILLCSSNLRPGLSVAKKLAEISFHGHRRFRADLPPVSDRFEVFPRYRLILSALASFPPNKRRQLLDRFPQLQSDFFIRTLLFKLSQFSRFFPPRPARSGFSLCDKHFPFQG